MTKGLRRQGRRDKREFTVKVTTDFNPLTPMSDQERISPYNINQISDENKEY